MTVTCESQNNKMEDLRQPLLRGDPELTDNYPSPSPGGVEVRRGRRCMRGHLLTWAHSETRLRCNHCLETFIGRYGWCKTCDYASCESCVSTTTRVNPELDSIPMPPSPYTPPKSYQTSAMSSPVVSPRPYEEGSRSSSSSGVLFSPKVGTSPVDTRISMAPFLKTTPALNSNIPQQVVLSSYEFPSTQSSHLVTPAEGRSRPDVDKKESEATTEEFHSRVSQSNLESSDSSISSKSGVAVKLRKQSDELFSLRSRIAPFQVVPSAEVPITNPLQPTPETPESSTPAPQISEIELGVDAQFGPLGGFTRPSGYSVSNSTVVTTSNTEKKLPGRMLVVPEPNITTDYGSVSSSSKSTVNVPGGLLVVPDAGQQQSQNIQLPQTGYGSSSSGQGFGERPIRKKLKSKRKQRRKKWDIVSNESSPEERISPMMVLPGTVDSDSLNVISPSGLLRPPAHQLGTVPTPASLPDDGSSGFSSHFSETVSTTQMVAEVDIQIQPPSTMKSKASSRDSLHAAITGPSSSRVEAANVIDAAMAAGNSPISPAMTAVSPLGSPSVSPVISFGAASRLALGIRGVRRKRASSIIGSSAGSPTPYIKKASKQKIREIVDKMNALLSGSDPLSSGQMKVFLNYGLVGAQGSPIAAALFYHKNINFTTLLRCKPDLLSSNFNLPLHRNYEGIGRSGEFYLHAAAHAHEGARFSMGQCTIGCFAECAKNPIHSLLLQLKFAATSEDIRSDSISILIEAIEYINESVWSTGEQHSESQQNSETSPTSRRLSIPDFIWDSSIYENNDKDVDSSSFGHVYCRKIPTHAEADTLAALFLPPEICHYCGIEHTETALKAGSPKTPKSRVTIRQKLRRQKMACPEGEAGVSFVECTPAELAVKLRLADVVKAMIGIDKTTDKQGLISKTKIIPHSVTGWDSHGRELQESNVRYETYIDVWDFQRRYLNKRPLFHDLLINFPMKHEYLLQKFERQADPINEPTTPLDTNCDSSVTEHILQPPPVRKNGNGVFHTFFPASYSAGCARDVEVRDNEDDDDVDFERLQILEHMIRGSSIQRQIKPFAMFFENSDAEDRGEIITTMYDRCGVFSTFDGIMGVTLLAQRLPILITKLFEYDLISRAPYKPHRLNTKVAEGPAWLLRQHRHLWRLTGNGSEMLIYDRGITFIHYLCLIGNKDNLEHFINLVPDDGKLVVSLFTTGTERMGWNVGHFCAYSNSWECLEYLLKKKYKYVQELNWPAAPFTAQTAPIEPWLLTQPELQKLKDGQFDHEKDHNPNVRDEDDHFGSAYPIGVAPLHVATSFGHYDCVDLLLRSGADCTRVSHFDSVDAHDIAICLHNRVKGRPSTDALIFEEKQAQQMQEEIVRIVNRMHLVPEVQNKLSLLTVRYVLFSLELIMHLLIITFIAVFAVSMRSDDDFFSTNALNEGIQKEEYIHELNTSVQTFSDIAEMEEFHAWLNGPLYRQLFETNEEPDDSMFLTFWHLVGSIQISQLRGTVGCGEQSWYHADGATTKPFLNQCHLDLRTQNEAGPKHISPITGRSYYLSPENFRDSPFTVTIPNNKTIAKTMIQDLETNSVFDSNTRAVILWINAYNPSVSSFSITTVLVEMPLHGMLYPYWKNRCVPVRNLDWSPSEWAFMVILYIYSAGYIIYHIISELIDIVQTNPIKDTQTHSLPENYTDVKSLNCLNWRDLAETPPMRFLTLMYYHTFKRLYIYLSREWNFIDLASLVAHLVLAVTHFEYIIITSDVLDELNQFPLYSVAGAPEITHFYETLTPLRDLRNNQLVALAFCIILYCLKLLKYITLFPSVGPVISALVNTCTSKNVFIFIFVWQFLVTAFSIGGHYIVFGEFIYNYRSLTEVFYAIQRHVLSDFDKFVDFQNGNTIAGPFFWLTATYICHLLLLNLFIAVISVDYSDNLNHAESSWAWKIVEKYESDLRWRNWFLTTKFFCRRLKGQKKVDEHTENWTIIWPGVLKSR